jgi:hypothetical protein
MHGGRAFARSAPREGGNRCGLVGCAALFALVPRAELTLDGLGFLS